MDMETLVRENTKAVTWGCHRVFDGETLSGYVLNRVAKFGGNCCESNGKRTRGRRAHPLRPDDVIPGKSIAREAEIKSVVQFADLVNVR